jgi:alpha-L-arabinofuranosidase
LTLKARKLGGDEGFLVLFQTSDIDNPTWWNIGGWRNTEHGIQGGAIPEERVRGSIQTNRWYDVRLELNAGKIKAFLDGKLIHEATTKATATFFASAGRDQHAKELVLQLVNPLAEPMPVAIKLNGAGKLDSKIQALTIANASAEAENVIDQASVVAPKTSEFNGASNDFIYTVEPFSLTTLRIPER